MRIANQDYQDEDIVKFLKEDWTVSPPRTRAKVEQTC